MRFAAAMLAVLAMTGAPGARAQPGDQMVFMVMSSGGMIPAVLAAMQSPSLAVYGDGRVLTALPAPALDLVPDRYQSASTDPAAVRDFIASARSGGLFTGTDFGSPRVTDLATTTVLLRDESGPVQVRAYALDPQFDAGLTAAQRDARSRLRALIAAAHALSGSAPAVPYSPDRVSVVEPLPGRNEEPAGTAWPGPAPASFMISGTTRRFAACGELSGPQAATVYQAALANPGARWLVDGGTRVLAVNPLPLDGCG